MFIELPARQGFGKIVSAGASFCDVRLFHSIDHQEVVQFPTEALDRAFLSPQTRVYVRLGHQWRAGRIKGFDPATAPWITYSVQFPNNQHAEYDELALDVRVFDPHADPSEILAHGGAETQFLHDRRWRAIESAITLRAAAQGQTALLSSSIELAPHQVTACRRVLTDPVQRYLLADEVGMGKTIEAGVIARQCLIDDPSRRVLVFTPRALVDQWIEELRQKCGLDDFPGRLEIFAHEQLGSHLNAPDLLIVDEAHRVLDDPNSFEEILRLAHAAPRVLLLSATPEIGEARSLLNLLHVIDPTTYGLDDLPKLQARLELGRVLGRLMMGLADSARPLLVRRASSELAQHLSDDTRVTQLAADIAYSDEGGLRLHAAELRFHLAENYRVHHRLVRARRSDAPLYFRPRGACVDGQRPYLREEVDEDERWGDIIVAIEDWRSDLAGDAEHAGEEERLRLAKQLFAGVEAIGFDLASATVPGVSPAISNALAAPPGERGDDTVAAESLTSLKARLIQQGERRPKIVAFASLEDRALRFARRLNDEGALSLTKSTPLHRIHQVLAQFRDDPTKWVLVCDRHAEEGLNLNFADAIVHLDLPFSISRVEQRIGRLDRFGRTKSQLRHRVLLPSDEDASPWMAWQELLTNGFGVFERSVSDIQFVLADLEADIAKSFLELGAEGLRAMIPVVKARIEEARKAIDEQYALDAVALSGDQDQLAEAIEDAEASESDLEAAAEGWLVSALQLKRRRLPDNPDTLEYAWTDETLIPKYPWRGEFSGSLRHKTWRRRIAVSRGAELLRPGAPIIDAMERFSRWEDRGTAYATWRVDPEIETADIGWAGFHFCFVIEPNLASVDRVFAGAEPGGLSRRAQSFLPPWTECFYLDVTGVTPSEKIIKILSRPYVSGTRDTGGADINLGSRSGLMATFMEPSAFADLCRHMRLRAESSVRSGEPYAVRTTEATRRANLNQVRTAARDGEQGMQTAERLLEAVRSPRVRLDSMGFIILSGAPPKALAR